MNAQLITTLLRITRSEEAEFRLSKGLEDFQHEYQLGLRVGSSRIRFSERDKQEIAKVLAGLQGIEAANADPQAWKELTRAQAMSLGHNEKLARKPVKRNRVSIKPLPGRALRLGGRSFELPDGTHLDADWTSLGSLGHACALLVENYEAFDQLHRTQVSVALERAGLADCLVIYRGDPNESRLDNVRAFLRHTGLPVVFFGDLDPASLVEMARTEGASHFVAPANLDEALQEYGNPQLFNQQTGAEFEALIESGCESVRAVCEPVRKARKGLAQEAFIGREISLQVLRTNRPLESGTL